MWLFLLACGALLASGLVVGALAAGGRGAAAEAPGGLTATEALAAGAVFSPTEATGFGWAGTRVVYTGTLSNLSSASDRFTLTLGSHVWTATLLLTQTGVLDPGAGVTVTVWVDIPAEAGEGMSDTVTLYAASHLSPTLVGTATLTTRVPRPGYAFLLWADKIAILDTVSHAYTGQVIDVRPYGQLPTSGAISPDGQWLYVSLGHPNSNSVLVISRTTHTPVMTIPVGVRPRGIAFSTDGKYAFVANWTDNTVSVIDTARHLVTATIPVGVEPWYIASSPCLDKIYVANIYDTVSVIDVGTLTVTEVITEMDHPGDVAISPFGDRVYTNRSWGNTCVWVIDTASDTVIQTWHVGDQSVEIDLSPDGNVLYVTGGPQQGTITAIDVRTGQQTTIPSGLEAERSIEVFPWQAGPFVYVGGFDPQMSVINIHTNSLIKTIPLPDAPDGLALFPLPTVCASRVYLPLVLRR